jgi:hypothetical protein
MRDTTSVSVDNLMSEYCLMCVHTNRVRANASARDAPSDCFRLSLAQDFDLQRQEVWKCRSITLNLARIPFQIATLGPRTLHTTVYWLQTYEYTPQCALASLHLPIPPLVPSHRSTGLVQPTIVAEYQEGIR